MIVHQLICLPTPDTIEYFKTVFDACPIELNWSEMYVEINSSAEPQEADISRSYVAYAGNLDKFYDSSVGESSLILPLNSPDLDARAQELREDAPSAFYSDMYFAHMVIKPFMPPLRPHRRGLIASYADVLSANQEPLVFDSELVWSREFFSIPQLDYYTTMQTLQRAGGSLVRLSNQNRI